MLQISKSKPAFAKAPADEEACTWIVRVSSAAGKSESDYSETGFRAVLSKDTFLDKSVNTFKPNDVSKFDSKIQSSLRDSASYDSKPGVKTPGYHRVVATRLENGLWSQCAPKGFEATNVNVTILDPSARPK